MYILFLIFYKDFIYLFISRERRGEGERETEKHQCVRETSNCCLPDQGPNCNPGMCPDWELKGQPLLCGRTVNQLGHIGRGCFFFLVITVLHDLFWIYSLNEGTCGSPEVRGRKHRKWVGMIVDSCTLVFCVIGSYQN